MKPVHGGNISKYAQLLDIDENQLIDFSANINPLGMPNSLRQAIVEQLYLAERYPDPDYRQLHHALAQHHQCSDWQILAGNGATELIFAICQIIHPRKALLLAPGFAEYGRALEQSQCDISYYMLDQANQFRPDEALLDVLTADLDCLFLCTPNNPTGQLIEAELLIKIAERCHQLNIMLIIDEAFIDFIAGAFSMTSQLERWPNLVVLRSLTKFFAIPGLRLGYLLNADPALMDGLRRQQQPWTINAFAALAGETIIADQEYIAASYRWLAEEQPRLTTQLAAIAELDVFPPAANYIFFRCRRADFDLQDALLKHGILIRSCDNYIGLMPEHSELTQNAARLVKTSRLLQALPGIADKDKSSNRYSYYRVAIKDSLANDKLIKAIIEVLSDS